MLELMIVDVIFSSLFGIIINNNLKSDAEKLKNSMGLKIHYNFKLKRYNSTDEDLIWWITNPFTQALSGQTRPIIKRETCRNLF